MSARSPTDTIILTGLLLEFIKEPTPLLHYLSQSKREIELIALPKFHRILLVCSSREDSKSTFEDLANLSTQDSDLYGNLSISYSIKDNDLLKNANNITSNIPVEYLELPLEHESRRFLISPPLSPPAEWDHWHKTEDGPNKQSIPSPQELSHLLWERLGGFDSDHVRKYSLEQSESPDIIHNVANQPEILFQNIDNGVPAIVLDSANENQTNKSNNLKSAPKLAKTAMPPVYEDM